MIIDQDRAKRDLASTIKTPFDADLVKLGAKLNTTYVAFGAAGQRGAANQVAQDLAAGGRRPRRRGGPGRDQGQRPVQVRLGPDRLPEGRTRSST